MSGKLGLFPASAPRDKHDHLRLQLDNDMELRFNDARRFGSLQLVEPGVNVNDLFAAIGPEPFADDFSPAYLIAKAKKRRQPVKNFLMDSRMVAGIGNIYASEILFCAGICPTTPAGNLTKTQWQRTVRCCRDVLSKAIASGGTTIGHCQRRHHHCRFCQCQWGGRILSVTSPDIRPQPGEMLPVSYLYHPAGSGRSRHLFLPLLPASIWRQTTMRLNWPLFNK
jgi:DNA-formamidopyrimidine glycosylase